MVSVVSEGKTAFHWSRDGVVFSHEGPDASLWLMRDKQGILVGRRQSGQSVKVLQYFVDVDVTDDGLSIPNNAEGLLPKDGFEIMFYDSDEPKPKKAPVSDGEAPR